MRPGYEGGTANRRLSLKEESVGSILQFAQFTPASPQNPPSCCFQLHAHQVENLHIYTPHRHRWKCLLPVSALLHINPPFFPSPVPYLIFFIAQRCNCCKSIKNKPSIKNHKQQLLGHMKQAVFPRLPSAV